MCRVTGYFGEAGESSAELLASVMAQRHGGPDDQTVLVGSGWGLGCCRLSQLDFEHGGQPYRLGDITAVFNGEIYNHNRLRIQLERRGYRFDGECDGNVIVALYLEYGEAFIDHLDGMFAIAIVDERTDRKFILCNDHVAMKSCYFHWSAERRVLHFSSELAALLAFSAVPDEIATSTLDSVLLGKTFNPGETAFSEIMSLGPAEMLIVESGQLRGRRWREFPTTRHDPDTPLGDLLGTEVAALLQGDTEPCFVVSGGLDSSLVAALAAERRGRITTFSIGYGDGWPADEARYSAAVSAHFSSHHHHVLLDPLAIPDLLPRVMRHMGQPHASPITVSTYSLFSEISAAGFRIALTGDGADELFLGYEHALQSVTAGRGGWASAYLHSLVSAPRRLRHLLYTDDYRAFVNRRDDIPFAFQPGDCHSIANGLIRLELSTKFPNYHLRRVDHLSMAHGVEARLPYCQRSIVDTALSLSEADLVDGQRGKLPLYELAASRLPASVLHRQKQPFYLPVGAMLAQLPPLRRYVLDVLTDRSVSERGELNTAAIERLITRHVERPSAQLAQTIWSLLAYGVWLQLQVPAKVS